MRNELTRIFIINSCCEPFDKIQHSSYRMDTQNLTRLSIQIL